MPYYIGLAWTPTEAKMDKTRNAHIELEDGTKLMIPISEIVWPRELIQCFKDFLKNKLGSEYKIERMD